MKKLTLIFFLLGSFQVQAASQHQRIIEVFNQLRADNLHILDAFYHPQLKFVDPIGEVSGLPAMKKYYENMYKSVEEIRFDFVDHIENQGKHFVSWKMTLKTPNLNGGEPMVMEGSSHINFEPETNLVIYHRDYFDMGAFIYEQIPVIGWIIRSIKKRFQH